MLLFQWFSKWILGRIETDWTEARIYKRKQESKKKKKENTCSWPRNGPRERSRKKENFLSFFLDRYHFFIFFLGCFLTVFLFFFLIAFLVESVFSCFLNFSYKFPPLTKVYFLLCQQGLTLVEVDRVATHGSWASAYQ